MSEIIQAFPLQWPVGWKRTDPRSRLRAKFNKKVAQYRDERDPNTGMTRRIHTWDRKTELSMYESTNRVLSELQKMGVDREDIVISTNVELRLDGLPKSGRRAPDDPGVAVYWRRDRESRCMAVDQYDRVEDNVAAIAATLDAMRAIERHGGAAILDRAFMGFTSLPSPESWWQVLGLDGPNATRDEIVAAHRKLAMQHHPDRKPVEERDAAGEVMARINRARDQGLETL